MQPLSRGAARMVALIVAALALVAALLPLPASPVMAQDDDAEADATLRVIHASPGAPEVDVLLDGQTLLQGLTYGAASSYATITPEEHRLQVVPTGQTADAAVVDETIDAAPGQAYLLAVFGLLNDIGGDIYDVDLSEIEPGNARVRLINFSPDAGDVDLLETGGDEWFGNVALGDASDYRDIPPGTYSADVRGDDDRVLLTVSELPFEETRVYDVVVLGQIADDSLELQSLVTTVSPSCAEVLGLEGSSSDACVRLVHTAPDAPPVDIYLNDAQIAQNLEFGTATEYVMVPSGAGRGVRVTATGTPVEEAVIDTALDFDPGQAYEILVTGRWRRPGGDDHRDGPATPGPGAGAAARHSRLARRRRLRRRRGGNEENLFEGVEFREATDYVVLDAGEYALEVRPGGEDMTVALQADATFEEGVTYDLIALGRPDDQTLTLLTLMAPVAIQTGDVATPEAASEDAAIAETVVPEAIEDVEVSPTPAG